MKENACSLIGHFDQDETWTPHPHIHFQTNFPCACDVKHDSQSGLCVVGARAARKPLRVCCHKLWMVDTLRICFEAVPWVLKRNHDKNAATTLISTPYVPMLGHVANDVTGKCFLLATQNWWNDLHMTLIRSCHGMSSSICAKYSGTLSYKSQNASYKIRNIIKVVVDPRPPLPTLLNYIWILYWLCNGWQQHACAAGAWTVSGERTQIRGTMADAETPPTVCKFALFAWLVHTRMPFSKTLLGLQVHCFRSFVPFSGFFIPMQSENVTTFAIGTES